MSATDVYRCIVDLHRTDRPRLVEIVVHASADSQAKAGITAGSLHIHMYEASASY